MIVVNRSGVVVKTRLAPTPSGYLHLGNLLNFVLVQAVAEQTGASLLLRIDDLDKARVRPEYVSDIFNTLRWMKINLQEGPADEADFYAHHSQHLRLPLYEEALQQLAGEQKVFACTCSRTEQAHCRCEEKNIDLAAPDASWKLRSAPGTLIEMNIYNPEPVKSPLPASMQNLMVRKRDGLPSYHLGSVVDDLHFGITHIVRGADLLESSLGQLYLAQCLHRPAFQSIRFLHHPLLKVAGTGEKLSKSAGAMAAFRLREKGWTAEDVCQELMRLLGGNNKAADPATLLRTILDKQSGSAQNS